MDQIGRYHIVRELGRGAMGVVYLANDPNIGRPVAIKTIRLGEVHKPEERERLRERLFREARSAGMLSHPGIVTIYDVDQQGDLAYIAMEYVDGPTLDHVLSQAVAIAPDQMFSVLGQAAVALDYAHAKGIVHRDIKPANIMIAVDGATKVTDFGIAKITTDEHLTRTGTIVGTPHYMSPEQVQGLAVDGRSDQFSLAVIAYEMLTGEKPYAGEHLTTVVYKIVAEEPAAPHRLNPTVAGAIENALRRGLAKKPEERYANCQEFASALERACSASPGWRTMPRGGSLNEPTVLESAKPAVTLPPARRARASDSATTERAAAPKSSFWAFLLAILVATGLLALIGWQATPWLAKNAAPPATATPAPQTPAAPVPAASAAPAPEPSPAGPDRPSPMPAPSAEPPSAAQPAPEPTSSGNPPAAAQPVLQPAPPTPQPEIPKPERPPAPQLAAFPVTVISSPGGATATLDGRSDRACHAPCSLPAAPGRHTIAVTMPGYQVEHRDVEIGTGPIELPPVVLRAIGGTLMVSSEPQGASILVDGRKLPQLTPAQLPLAPGTYRISVEKDGRQGARTVEVRNGVINYLKVELGP
ncbi:MAG: protein kinase [Acidobacteriia bacterium]|nr:protein kinase [Terriglobia bacterium]